MLAEDATARRQSVLYQVVVELDHGHRSLVYLPVDDVDDCKLTGKEDDLQDDRDHFQGGVLGLVIIV